MRWRVRLHAEIDDEIEIEADSEVEAREAAEEDWTFTEAHSWQTVSVERIEEDG